MKGFYTENPLNYAAIGSLLSSNRSVFTGDSSGRLSLVFDFSYNGIISAKYPQKPLKAGKLRVFLKTKITL